MPLGYRSCPEKHVHFRFLVGCSDLGGSKALFILARLRAQVL